MHEVNDVPIDARRFAGSGAIAGLLYTVGGMVAAAMTGLPDIFAEYGVEPSAVAAVKHVALRFGLGFATVGLVALTARRRGRALLLLILAIWFCAYVPGSVVLHELGVLPTDTLAFALAWGLAESFVATQAGAWFYHRRRSTGPV